MKPLWRILALAIGVAAFGWCLSQVGLKNVSDSIRQLGGFAPLVLLPYSIVYIVDCLAWTRTLPRHQIPFFTLFKIRWAGESVNSVLPSAYIGGEAVKVGLLQRHGISPGDGATTAIISRTAQTVAQLAFVLLASAILLGMTQGQPRLQAFVGLMLLGGLAGTVTFLWLQKRGLFRTALAALESIGGSFRFLEQRKNSLLRLDETIIKFHGAESRRFLMSTCLYFAGWLLDTIEICLVAYLLGLPITWSQALVVEAFAGISKILGMWVPGSLGVQESGIVLIGRVVGLPDTLSAPYALIRRGREMIFAAVGLSLLYADRTFRSTAKLDPVAP